MFDELWNRFLSLPWKDWAGPLIAGGFTVFGGTFAYWNNWTSDRRKRKADQAKIEHEAGIASGADMTHRLNLLMDGYEKRVTDLSHENTSLKLENKSISEAYERHVRICLGCVHFSERSRAAGGLTDY